MLNTNQIQVLQVSYWQDTKTAKNSLFLFDFTRCTYPPVVANSVLEAAQKLFQKVYNRPFTEIQSSEQVAFVRRLQNVKVYAPQYLNNVVERVKK